MINNNLPILPNDRNFIGILGGGQLGKLIALSASKAGYKTHLYCPKGDNPAEMVVDKITNGDTQKIAKKDRLRIRWRRTGVENLERRRCDGAAAAL